MFTADHTDLCSALNVKQRSILEGLLWGANDMAQSGFYDVSRNLLWMAEGYFRNLNIDGSASEQFYRFVDSISDIESLHNETAYLLDMGGVVKGGMYEKC
jgi:hypothetical protein